MPEDAARHLQVGGEIAVLTGDERVFAGPGRSEEVRRPAPAHHPGLGLHLVGLQPATLEDAHVGRSLQLEILRKARLVAVERVGVLHDELAQPDQARTRPRLVAFLDREVVEHLRQLPITLQLACVEGDRLLVRHRQHVFGTLPILEPEELQDVVAPRLLPELEGGQNRHQHLLAADRVHLVADDLLDLAVHLPAEWQERPHTSRDLPDETAAHEQLVVDGLGVCRSVAQGRQKET